MSQSRVRLSPRLLALLALLLLSHLASSPAMGAPRQLVPGAEDGHVVDRAVAAWQNPPFNCPYGHLVEGARTSYRCPVAAGHVFGVALERFASIADAEAAFAARRADHPPRGFHGFDATAWQFDENPGNPNLPLRHREFLWQAGNQLYSAFALDDTLLISAPDPADLAERLHEAALAQHVLPGTWSDTPIELNLVAEQGARLGAMYAVSPSELYVAVGASLARLDLSEPGNARLGPRRPLPAVPERFIVRDGFAYLALGDAGFEVLDLATGEGRLYERVPGPSGMDVALNGNYAYIVGMQLVVLDITEPLSFREVAVVDTGYARRLAVSVGYAYLADPGLGLTVVNVRNPARPVVVGRYFGHAWGVGVYGNRALVANGSDAVELLNVADPTAPRPLSAYPFTEPQDLYMVDDTAMVGMAGGNELAAVLRFYYPEEPAVDLGVGRSSRPGARGLPGLAIADGMVYWTDPAEGLASSDIAKRGRPEPWLFAPGLPALDVDLAGDRAYAAAGSAGLKVMDAGSLSALPVTEIELRADRVVVSGSSIFVTRPGALDSFVIHAPDAVSQESSIEGLPGTTHPMAVSEGYAFVVTGVAEVPDGSEPGLQILNVREPGAPRLAGHYVAEAPLRDVAVLGWHALVLDATTLHVLDVSDPAAPRRVGRLFLPGSPWRLAASGEHAFVADSLGMLQVVDLSEPFRPRLVGAIPAPRQGEVAAAEGRLVVAGDGLVVLDVRDPADPRILAVDEHHYGGGIALRGRRAYIAAGERGLVVLDLGRRAAGAPLYLPFALAVSPSG